MRYAVFLLFLIHPLRFSLKPSYPSIYPSLFSAKRFSPTTKNIFTTSSYFREGLDVVEKCGACVEELSRRLDAMRQRQDGQRSQLHALNRRLDGSLNDDNTSGSPGNNLAPSGKKLSRGIKRFSNASRKTGGINRGIKRLGRIIIRSMRTKQFRHL